MRNKQELLDERATEVMRRVAGALAAVPPGDERHEDLTAYARVLRSEHLLHRDPGGRRACRTDRGHEDTRHRTVHDPDRGQNERRELHVATAERDEHGDDEDPALAVDVHSSWCSRTGRFFGPAGGAGCGAGCVGAASTAGAGPARSMPSAARAARCSWVSLSRLAVFRWATRCNTRRRHSGIGQISPNARTPERLRTMIGYADCRRGNRRSRSRVKPRAAGGGTTTALPQIPTRTNGKR
ncbi:hypothetical protein QFZ64_000417 [Streptomyces sp. B3I8]|nr:hypothetical protein [Streptomyces sp. B3I8]